MGDGARHIVLVFLSNIYFCPKLLILTRKTSLAPLSALALSNITHPSMPLNTTPTPHAVQHHPHAIRRPETLFSTSIRKCRSLIRAPSDDIAGPFRMRLLSVPNLRADP